MNHTTSYSITGVFNTSTQIRGIYSKTPDSWLFMEYSQYLCQKDKIH